MNFLLDDPAATVNISTWILPAILLLLFIGIFIMNYFRSKKAQDTMKNMVDSLKVGDNVKTYSGLYGKILEITETTDGKVVVLETGSDNHKGIFSIDINAIYAIDAKQPVVYDKDGNIIEPQIQSIENIEKVEVKQEKIEQPKKVTTKKTATKKTGTKKKTSKTTKK